MSTATAPAPICRQAYQRLVYVVVVQKATGRAFTLNRGYSLLHADIADNRTIALWDGQRITSVSDGWLPSGESQRPAWIEGLPDSDFTAYWLSE